MKIQRIDFLITFAPCTTKSLTILNEFALIAILRGHSLILREYNNKMISINGQKPQQNNDKYQKNENLKRKKVL